MRARAIATLTIGISIGSAHAADDRYDEKLARAAAEIVASRIGPLRGSLDIDHQITPSLPPPLSMRGMAPTPSPGVWQDGLAVAIERKPTASPEL